MFTLPFVHSLCDPHGSSTVEKMSDSDNSHHIWQSKQVLLPRSRPLLLWRLLPLIYVPCVFFLVLPPKNKCSTFWSVSGKCCHPWNFGTFTVYFLYASFLPATFYGVVAWWFTILASHGKPIFKNKSTRRINRILKGRWWFPESSLMFPEVPQSFLGILKVPQLPSPLKNPTRYLFKTLTIVTSPLR